MSLGRRAQKPPSRETAAKAEEKRVAEAAKIIRLRALRLAKEAAARDALPVVPLPLRSRGALRPRRANDAP